MKAHYDTIGRGYSNSRCTDPKIFALLERQLGEAQHILNIGAGTGSYEPEDRQVTALEPSMTMIAQRPSGAAPVVQAVAEAMPFPNRSFDAAMGILTLHHWQHWQSGLMEASRVSGNRVLLLTWIGFRLVTHWSSPSSPR